MKQCSKCKEFKGEGEFSKDKKKKDGLTHWCKSCRAAAYAARADHLATLEEIICTGCGETKPEKEFHRGQTQCKVCQAAAQAARADHLATLEERTCTGCGKTKPGKEFSRGCSDCKSCQTTYHASRAERLATLEERTCTKCGKTKPGKEFSRGQVQCKACVDAWAAARHASTKHDKILYIMSYQLMLDEGIVVLGETTNLECRKPMYSRAWPEDVITLHTYPLGDKTDKDVFRYLADHGVLPVYGEFYRYNPELIELLDSYFHNLDLAF